jgi:hypothetical protein
MPLSKAACEAAEHVMRYLRATQLYGLRYCNGGHRGVVRQNAVKLKIECYTDANFMGDPVDGKSTGGFVVLLNGCVVHWVSKKQVAVARSTFSAEYVAMAQGIDEALALFELLKEMSFEVEEPVCIWGDNDANNNVLENKKAHQPTRAVDNAYHYIRDVAMKRRIVKVQRVDTKENVADIFTKALPPSQFEYLRSKLMCVVSDSTETKSSERKGGMLEQPSLLV